MYVGSADTSKFGNEYYQAVGMVEPTGLKQDGLIVFCYCVPQHIFFP